MDWGGNIEEGEERSLVLKWFLGGFIVVGKWGYKKTSVTDNGKLLVSSIPSPRS